MNQFGKRATNRWWTSLVSALAAIIFLTGTAPLRAEPQKGKDKDEARERTKERKDDAKERVKERKEDGKERAQERKEDAKDRTKDKVGVDARVKGRAYVRPEVSTRVNTYWKGIGPARRPFTVGWYKSHPTAWRYSFGVRRPWAPASYVSVARFIGITGNPAVFVYENPAPWTQAQWTSLAASNKAIAGDSPAEDDVMPLGVFSLLPPDASESNTVLQLNITKNGALVGSYYDMLSDTGQPVNGTMNRESQHAIWSIGNNADVAFETGLENLTSESAPVLVHTKDSGTQRWTLIRVADESSAETTR